MTQLRYILSTQKKFWTILVPQSWERITFTEKVIWLFFINHTIAIITLIEYAMLRR